MIRILYRYGLMRWLPLCLLSALVLSSITLLRVGHTQTGPVELVARRTLASKTFRNPDGSLTLQAYGGPIHYYDATGTLRDINLNLRAQLSGEYSYIADGIPFGVQVGPNATSPVRVAQGNDYVVYRLQGATIASAFASGNEVRYGSALTQTDKRHTVTPNGLKEILTLRSPLAPTSFSYLIETNLRISQVTSGLVFSRSSGEPVFLVPNPTAVDAVGTRITNMTYTLTPSGSNTLLSFSLPSVLGLVYPIQIDPTTTTYSPFPGDGAVANSGANWSTVQSATVGNNASYQAPTANVASTLNNGTYNISRMFFAFDTGEIPDNAIISTTTPPTLQFNVALVTGTLFANTIVHVVTASQAKVWQLTTSDYAAVGATSKGFLDLGTTTGLKTITLDVSAINVFGITQLALRAAQDLNNQTPTTDGPTYVINTSKETVLPRPVLSVTYTDVPDLSSVVPNETGFGAMPNVNYYGSDTENTNLLNGNLVVSPPAVPSQPGRGVTLGINAVYNLQIWQGSTLVSSDYPVGLGWRLNLGQIAAVYVGANFDHFMYIDPTGARHNLLLNATDGYYYSSDSTYLKYSHGSNTLWFKDGTNHVFNWVVGGNQPDAYTRCVSQIRDTNGNYISVTYQVDSGYNTSRISQIVDTANRVSVFSYGTLVGDPSYQRLTTIQLYGPGQLTYFGSTYFNYGSQANIVAPPPLSSTPVTRVVLNSIVFVSGQAMSFQYNTSGELTQINYLAKGTPPQANGPVRGYLRYAHQWTTSAAGQVREVQSRWTSADGTAASERLYTFIPTVDNTMSNHAQTIVEDAALNHTVHVFFYNQPVAWKNGLEYQTLVQQGPGPSYTTLRTVNTVWTQDNEGVSNTLNPRPASVTTTLEDGTTQSQVTLQTDAYGNTTQVKEYDYASLTTALRVTNIYYLQTGSPQIPPAPGYISKWIVNRPIQIDVTDDASPTPNLYTRTVLSYDTYPSGQFLDTPGIINHDSFYDTFITMRGNVWSRTVGLAPDPTATTQSYYDTAGNEVKVVDPQGHQTQATLDTTTNYTFARLITNALSQNVTLTFNDNTTLANYTGIDNQPIGFLYDPINRPTRVNRPDGGYTTYNYNDTASPLSVSETKLIDNTQTPNLFLNLITYYDGFGRPTQRGTQRDANNWEWVQYVYDNCTCSSIGRQTQVSNPYITGQTPVFTTTQYDALGRVAKIIPPDGTPTSNNITYTYQANTVTITDQAGKWKTYTYDALGRLTKASEPDGAVTRDTTYSYNPLGQLLTIVMNAQAPPAQQQTRSFTYATSRGWLKTETHPESGTTTYTYTTEGLLDTKTDAKGTVAHYQYDNMHRLTGIRYDPNTFNDVTYTYDTVQVGKLSLAAKLSSDGTYNAEEHSYTYDPVGRILSETYGHRDSNTAQPLFTLAANYQYNQLGNLTQILYPTSSARRRLDFTYNQMGRATKIHNYYGVQGGVSPDFDVVNTLSYNAGGIISSFNYGNNMTECRSYNTRTQATGQKLYTSLVSDCSNPGAATTAMDYTYNYPSANNGRLQSMVDNLDATKTQTFTYDSLNRLSQSTVGTTTTLTFAYDAYGNRTAQTAIGPGPTVNLTYDTNNHITTAGYGYDPNGNLTAAPVSTVYNYDKENRLLSVTVASTTQGQYAYDGLGRRISKITPANNTQTFYFNTQVGVLGEYQRTAGTTQTPTLMKEYVYLGKGVVATMENSGLTRKYYHMGRLANTRKVTNDLGTVLETHDYYPFGEEVVDLGDNNKPKFTGYYRDSETKMDYALNRYDNSSIGRFLTADPYQSRNAQNKPQLWNKYAYVGNDPINFVDRTGKEECVWVPIPDSDGMEEEVCFYDPGLLQVGNNSGPGHPSRSAGGSRIQFKNCEGEKGRAIVKDIEYAWPLVRLAINENPSPLQRAGEQTAKCIRQILDSDGILPPHYFGDLKYIYPGGPIVFNCTGAEHYAGEASYWQPEIRVGAPALVNSEWHIRGLSYTQRDKFFDAPHLILHELLHICSILLSEKQVDEIVDQYFPPFDLEGSYN